MNVMNPISLINIQDRRERSRIGALGKYDALPVRGRALPDVGDELHALYSGRGRSASFFRSAVATIGWSRSSTLPP